MYRPAPNTAWVSRLLARFLHGVGVFDAAMPAPIAGCMTNSGTSTAPMPTSQMADPAPDEGEVQRRYVEPLQHPQPQVHHGRCAHADEGDVREVLRQWAHEVQPFCVQWICTQDRPSSQLEVKA
jgi:hypothetical protein